MPEFNPESEREPHFRYASPVSKTDRAWAMACHLSALSIFLCLPFGNILAPLAIWVFKKEESPLVDDQGKESLNFQISLMIYATVAWMPVPWLFRLLLLPAMILFTIALTLYGIVMVILASIRAYEGESYRYPLTIRLIR